MDDKIIMKLEQMNYTTGNVSTDAANESKRRSSNRSIKRKRFDDEIVEYSLGIPPTQIHRIGRTRTHSQTYSSGIYSGNNNTVAGVEHTITISSPTSVATPQITQVTAQQNNIPATIVATTNPSILSTQTINGTMAIVPSPATTIVSSTINAASSGTGNNSAIVNSSVVSTASTTALDNNKRRGLKGNRKSKKNRCGNQIATKDLGRWKPIDDLALIIGIQQTNDLRMVHRGTKFSCKFTIAEMQSRWYSLLYEEPISRIAVAAIRNLHPEIVESVHSRALYSIPEEDLLSTIKSTNNPTLETFQDLLDANVLVFYPARTAKTLSTHWHLMRQYSLLPDQVAQVNPKCEQLLNFSDVEDMLNDADLADTKDEAFEIELALADRKNKKEMRHLENEISRWSVLVDSLPGIGLAAEFDNQTLAVLRGRLVRFLMRSREITFGRSTKDQSVDVDLSLEGPSHKVSRKQGTIKMRSNGDFFISNEGKRPLFIDGIPLLQTNKTRLNNNCVVEIAGLRFIFLVNHELISAIRQESAKMNGPLN